jgi:peptidyl-prolyl cis-trans isomerase SurA
MRKLLFTLFFGVIAHGLFAQTLFTYGNHSVSKQEFLRAYNKNKPTTTDKSKALKEYLDLYIKFKLKVQAAKDLRYDTLPALVSDLENFRSQVLEAYLNDEQEMNRLIYEAFDRSQKDIHLAYLFIPFKGNSDSSKLPAAAKQAAASADLSGQEGVLKKSGVTANYLDAGYMTVFTLPYEMENVVYGLKQGQISAPYKTKAGYYIFKNIGERPAVGRIRAAQILIAVPINADEADRTTAKKTADSVYKLLKNGADFGDLASKVSNDKTTFLNGGVMDEFGAGKYSPEFEQHVFALKKDGEISEPFLTEYGYHIVKQMNRTPVPHDKSNSNTVTEIKQRIITDKRGDIAKQKFMKQIYKLTGYKLSPVNYKDLWRVTDSATISNKKITAGTVNEKTVLITFTKGNKKVSDWLQYLKNYKSTSLNPTETNKEIFDKFTMRSASDYYRAHLEELNPEFNFQVQEFKEGNMLFEIMEGKVWSKASADSLALVNYYKDRKDKYKWDKSAEAVVYSTANSDAADKIYKYVSEGQSMQDIKKELGDLVQSDSSRFEYTQLPIPKETTIQTKAYKTTNPSDGGFSIVKVLKLYPAGEQRSYDEAKGLVLNDYQTYLEDKWIAELKKKYPVKVNEVVVQSLVK